MKRFVLALLLGLMGWGLQAQVVNTERKRLGEQDGWQGNIDVGFSVIRNTKSIVSLTNRMNLQYQKNRHTLLALNDISLLKVDENALQNKGFQHIRYNYQLRSYLIPEAFVQGQYNQIMRINKRFLAGAGPRFQIFQTDSSRLFLGSLYMYEYEEVSDTNIINRDHRLSAYVSTGYTAKKFISIDHITYFQPKLTEWSDFRISSETTLAFHLSERLVYKNLFSLVFDSRPPEGLDRTWFTFTNSLGFKF